MENSLLKSREQANKQKVEIDGFSKVILEKTNQLTEAGKKLDLCQTKLRFYPRGTKENDPCLGRKQ